MSIESVIQSNHLILCRPLLLLPSIFPSIKIFSNESVFCITLPKCWSFRFSISPSNEYLELISFRIDWFDLFAVQGTLKSLLQHHNVKASLKLTQYCKLTLFVFQPPSHVWLFSTPWTAAYQASLSLSYLLKFAMFMSIALVMPSSCLINHTEGFEELLNLSFS